MSPRPLPEPPVGLARSPGSSENIAEKVEDVGGFSPRVGIKKSPRAKPPATLEEAREQSQGCGPLATRPASEPALSSCGGVGGCGARGYDVRGGGGGGGGRQGG